jgi:DHA1 family multidrug resistance protein-like MFS transporter
MPHWKRNLAVLGTAQLLTMVGFTTYLSFLAYYVQELGNLNEGATVSWVALFSSGSALAMAIFSPIWGTLADRYGRKVMLVRATAAGAVLAGLMSMAQNPAQLTVLRILQGIFCGTVGASITLVAAETPREHLATALGLMQTAQYGGRSLGPLFGGLLADAFGFRTVFIAASVLLFVSLFIILFLAREEHQPEPKAAPPFRLSTAWSSLRRLTSRNALVLLLTLGSNSFAVTILSPVLALYIKALSGDTARLATLAGSVVGVTALTSSLTAVSIGPLARRVGQKRLLLISIVGAAAIHVPQAFVANTLQLLILRAVQGLFVGGILPMANALLAESTPQERRGTIFGLSGSAQSGARAVGPAVGAAVSNAWGMASTFLVTGTVFGLLALLVGAAVRPPGAEAEAEADQSAVKAGAKRRAGTSPSPPGSSSA